MNSSTQLESISQSLNKYFINLLKLTYESIESFSSDSLNVAKIAAYPPRYGSNNETIDKKGHYSY